MSKVIYKRTATGAIQQWCAEIEGSRYRTRSGQLDGTIVTTDWVQCQGTNIGRSNERTPEEQAIFEVKALYKKKLERDYHEDIDCIDDPLIFAPMLAKEYGDYADKIDFTNKVFAQPKLDGIRCIATERGLFSRNGKPILGVPHIIEALKPLFDYQPDLILDGELYNHAYRDDFNAIVGTVKKQKPTEEDLEKARLIQYHVYDLPSADGGFAERHLCLRELLAMTDFPIKTVPLVQTIIVRDLEAIDRDLLCQDPCRRAALRPGEGVCPRRQPALPHHQPPSRCGVPHMTISIPLPDQKFPVLLMDPPWRATAYTEARSGTPRRIEGDHYPTMSLAELKALPVASIAAKECALFMWVVDTHLDQALELGCAWGFRYSSIAFVWRKMTKHGKDHFGMGKTTRKGVEICLLFMKEPPKRQSAAVRQYLTGEEEWIDAKVREHSRKPDEQYERIEALYNGPYCELFARQHRPGWEAWGLETTKFDSLPDDILALLGGDLSHVKADAAALEEDLAALI